MRIQIRGAKLAERAHLVIDEGPGVDQVELQITSEATEPNTVARAIFRLTELKRAFRVAGYETGGN
jgi:hypothetical protein